MDDLHPQEPHDHRPPRADRSPTAADLTPATAHLAPAVRERLATERIAWLCTLRPDGSPHVTPVWFVFVRGTWWIGADGGSVKARNAAHDPRVSLALEGGEAPVVAEGRARIWRAPAETGSPTGSTSVFPPDVVAAFLAKYDWDVTLPHRPASGRVLFEVPVGRWLLAGTAQ
ncbi:pyridoxamine 5'-phosphate oxidase [Streptomyces sp. WAC 06725]|uniref:pyridoxamine 5'-phosphate oxidase family protein n=1 Tax=Streptomyces sp. WAC 06725 TaxID=2203209 RepID=UPI000F737F0B|nr:pyridoxamine 5'-phosphate oxidase family protein [Streptomyces sp. WAC 06725]RSO10029.1 pyridoxamine 5'-phosphate oxidase [Streptomyces sp. WAC 06725]